MGQVDHPNCVKLWDVFSDKDHLCLVLDLCEQTWPLFPLYVLAANLHALLAVRVGIDGSEATAARSAHCVKRHACCSCPRM